MRKNINVALIGAGGQGKWQSSAIAAMSSHFPDASFNPVRKVLCDPVPDLESRREGWGWEYCEADWRAVVGRADVDLVEIATPTGLHRDIFVAAARAGKMIFCEKALAISVSEAQEMCDVAADTGVPTAVAFNKRRWPAIVTAKGLVDDGYIGEPILFQGKYHTSSGIDPNGALTWRYRRDLAGSGPMHEMASHLFDATRYLLGEFSEVVGDVETHILQRPVPGEDGKKGAVDVEDSCSFIARMENGVLASFDTSRVASGEHNRMRFELFGREGSIRWDARRPSQLDVSSEAEDAVSRGVKTIEMGPDHVYGENLSGYGDLAPGFVDNLCIQLHDFIEASLSGRSYAPNAIDGLRINELLEAVFESVRTRSWARVGK